jgi:hypothetical protein
MKIPQNKCATYNMGKHIRKKPLKLQKQQKLQKQSNKRIPTSTMFYVGGGWSVLFLSGIIPYIIISNETAYIRQGAEMLYANQCNTISQRTLGFIYLDNPVCRIYNRIYTTISRVLEHDFYPAIMAYRWVMFYGNAIPSFY